MALELQGNQLVFSFPKIHPEAKLAIEFQRTLRIPDDDKTYPLPPGLGTFPMVHTEDHLERVPELWRKHGGVMIPMYQSEALWIRFAPHHVIDHGHAYPFAVKVSAGKKSALTGEDWRKGLHKKDYCIIPKQPWLDGFVVEDGVIRQFIAVPLGQGLSVEEQLGDDEIGGLQIEVFPMKRECFEKRWPKRPRITRSVGRGRRSRKGVVAQCYSAGGIPGASAAIPDTYSLTLESSMDSSRGVEVNCFATMDMAMGAGGQMKQEVFDDPYGKEEWSRKSSGIRRCFVHLANSLMWRQVTDSEPPTTPFSAAEYKRHGFPWFDYYDDGQALKGTKKLKGVKSVKDKAAEKGLKGVLPENKSVKVKDKKVHKLGPGEVRNGSW